MQYVRRRKHADQNQRQFENGGKCHFSWSRGVSLLDWKGAAPGSNPRPSHHSSKKGRFIHHHLNQLAEVFLTVDSTFVSSQKAQWKGVHLEQMKPSGRSFSDKVWTAQKQVCELEPSHMNGLTCLVCMAHRVQWGLVHFLVV